MLTFKSKKFGDLIISCQANIVNMCWENYAGPGRQISFDLDDFENLAQILARWSKYKTIISLSGYNNIIYSRKKHNKKDITTYAYWRTKTGKMFYIFHMLPKNLQEKIFISQNINVENNEYIFITLAAAKFISRSYHVLIQEK